MCLIIQIPLNVEMLILQGLDNNTHLMYDNQNAMRFNLQICVILNKLFVISISLPCVQRSSLLLCPSQHSSNTTTTV